MNVTFQSFEDFPMPWLIESPQRHQTEDVYSNILCTLNDWINNTGLNVIDRGNNYKSISATTLEYWWYELNGRKPLIVKLEKKPESVHVRLLGKDPEFSGKPPFTSDMYLYIVRNYKPVRLHSDIRLSDEGMKTWKRLVRNGANIAAYDQATKNPSVRINSISDLHSLWRDDPGFKNWSYAILENQLNVLEFQSRYGTHRFKVLNYK